MKNMLLNNEPIKLQKPDCLKYSDDLFGIKKRMSISCFKDKTDLVPEIDKGYVFDEKTTISILAGFKFNKKTHFRKR